jgi:MAF protein
MKIYLASKSKARSELLKSLGLKFKVIPVKVEEKGRRGGAGFAGLVKYNALKKAKAAAAKIKDGLIIGADTISVQEGKIFGKPANLKEARSMLKRFGRAAQWVYTGVALIDKKRGVCLTDYEKTKVYMDRLSDSDISGYFRKVSPVDKAGSFDIQGRGAFFVRRIEGDFYNVVGLPLRKLFLMLGKLDVKLFVFSLSAIYYLLSTVFISGCSTEYNIVTGQEESYYYSTDKEVQMGESIVKQVEQEYKLDGDPLVQKRVRDIGQKVAAVSDRKEIKYYFNVLDDDEVNAVALPGGFVYVNKGLVDRVDNDDELAAVLAHEVGHIVARHSIKKLQAAQGYSLLRVLIAASPAAGEAGSAADAAFTELILGYGREDELLADQLGARYAKLAGYNPRAMIDFLDKLQKINRRQPLRPRSYYKTHPYVPDRVRVVKQELGEKITFDDYINIEQKPHE